MNKRKNPFLEFLAACCVFSVFLDTAIRGVLVFDFYYNYIFFVLFLAIRLMETGRIVLPPRWFLAGMGAIFITSLFILLVDNMLGFTYWKQVFGILFTSVVYYNVLDHYKFNISRIFSLYLKFAYWVALFGLFDNVLHVAGIHITRKIQSGQFQFRESSIMGEPFYLALALTPAVVYYLCYFQHTWSQKKKQLLVILICYFLTYSSIAVAGFVIGVFFALYVNNYFSARKGKLLLIPIAVLPVVLLLNFLIDNVNLISARFSDTTELFLTTELKTDEAATSNSSTFALYSNFIIARDSFLNDPLFGSGLGSHPLIYQEAFLKYFSPNLLTIYGNQNQQDANSKFLRLMSETGIVGLILFLFAFFKFFVPNRMTKFTTKELTSINYAMFTYITLCLIRNGNYINIGFFLFFFIYYISWKITKNSIKRRAVAAPTSGL